MRLGGSLIRKAWFRVDLLLAVRKRTRAIVIERWQLSPPDTPGINSTIITSLCQQNVSPSQPVATEEPFATQELTVIPTSTRGSPLVIPFMGVMGRAPMAGESGIVLNGQQLMKCAGNL